MPDTFNCPNCGAPLDYKGSDPIIRCPYCNSSVVVPENLRSKPSFSSQPHNFTLSGSGDMAGLVRQARRFKEVKDLAQAGNMDEAVRIYSEITGQNPEMARASVQTLASGRPITLTGLNLGELMPSMSVSSTSTRVSLPTTVNPQSSSDKPPKSLARTLGCGLGCFVTAIFLFALLTAIVPMMGGLAGMAVSLKPDLVLTVIPSISNLTHPGFGSREFSFGGEGIVPGKFDDVRAITIDPVSGNIYAAEYSSGRIQKFDPQGKFISQWLVEGEKMYTSSIAADRNGNIFIVSSGKLLQYNLDGKLIKEITVADFDQFDDIALAADGSLLAVNGEDVIHFNPDGKVLSKIPAAISTVSGDPELDAKIAVDGRGNIYVLGTFNNAVFKFAANGKFINRFGSEGDQPGQFSAASAIAVDGKGQIYVSDSKGIQVFSNDGRYINVVSVEYYAYGLSFDDQGKLYATTNQNKVDKFNVSQ